MSRTWIIALLLPLTACTGGDVDGTSVTNERLGTEEDSAVPASPSATDSAEDAAALEAAALAHADSLTEGDYAAAWALWADAAQEEVDEEAYVAYAQECTPAGTTVEVSEATLVEPGRGTVVTTVDGATRSHELVHEDGEWRWVPEDSLVDALAGASADDLPACA